MWRKFLCWTPGLAAMLKTRKKWFVKGTCCRVTIKQLNILSSNRPRRSDVMACMSNIKDGCHIEYATRHIFQRYLVWRLSTSTATLSSVGLSIPSYGKQDSRWLPGSHTRQPYWCHKSGPNSSSHTQVIVRTGKVCTEGQADRRTDGCENNTASHIRILLVEFFTNGPNPYLKMNDCFQPF
jgi:hypothetical protein